MEYRTDLTNAEYTANFKCCKNCPNWQADYTLQGDYAYNGCVYWSEKGLQFLTPWAAFCDGYAGGKKSEGPFHKLVLTGENKLAFEAKAGENIA